MGSMHICRKCGCTISDVDSKFGCPSCAKRGYVYRSCWLIKFEDGFEMIISEDLYNDEVKRNWGERKKLYESHWFDFDECREKNRGIPCFGF